MSAPQKDGAVGTPSSASEEAAKEEKRSALLAWTVVGILLTAGLSFVVMTLFVRLIHGEGSWWKIGDHELAEGQWFEAARVTVALVALTVAGGAAYLAYRRQHTADQNQKTAAQTQRITAQAYQLSTNQYETTLRRERRDRFTDAASQLAHASAAVRIAGVYAMASLADDWNANNKPNEAQACIDVLCGYLRLPYDPEHAVNHQTKRIITTSRTHPDGTAAQGEIEEHFEYRQNDREVRKTIVRVIRDHVLPEAETSWSEKGFDFQGAVLEDVDLQRAIFNGPVSFRGAQFHGEGTSFSKAEFHSGRTSFVEAQFHGERTLFSEAQFHGGMTSFSKAEFHSGISFFIKAQFHGGLTSFNKTQFHGRASFGKAQFHGGLTSFGEAQFHGHRTSFVGAQFRGERTMFSRAQFHSRWTSFVEVQFRGEQTSFSKAQFHSKQTLFENPRAWSHVYFDWDPRPPYAPIAEKPDSVLPEAWPPTVQDT
ncbi:hypothetical protein EN35_01615 [Rhodococcus qingshengii]|nr:hypothetical protein EN35_01615 [Rhodococcus qingshengii]